MAKIRQNADGSIGLGRNKSWAARQGSSAGGGRKTAQGPSRGRYARNSADAAARAGAKGSKRRRTLEDEYTPRTGRIRDNGQAVPKGYMRTGGLYFAKVSNMRPIQSKTTKQQRAMVYANRNRFWGKDGESGWIRSVGNTGMYDAKTSEANFRKQTAARKAIDRNRPPSSRASARPSKSRYIIAFGQDGHVR